MDLSFLLKKIISLFLMPLPIGMLLIFFALVFLFYSKHKKGRIVLSIAFIWLFIFSYAPVSNWLLYQIEHRYPTLKQAPDDTAYIYILGYGHHTDNTLPITSQIDKEAIVRLNEGIRLYHQLHGKAKLIVSGYSGLFDPTPHALMQQKLAMALHIPSEDIIALPQPKDTQEEAKAAKNIAQGQALIVVSSAYHMPRALKWFQKEHLHFYAAPTYHQSSITHPDYLGIFSAEALRQSTIFFHETIGMLWQKIKGD